MGFLSNYVAVPVNKGLSTSSIELLHKMECRACPLRDCHNRHPDMEPTGAKHPLVYMLGEAPGEDEDRVGRQFVGRAGEVLRYRIPERRMDSLRWNNVVRSRPPGNRNPTPVEIECCRPSLERDIEASKPVAIFGFGAVPLKWALGMGKISDWNGRRIPVQIGQHKCWYFPMYHPSFIARTRRFTPRNTADFGSDIEHVFALNLKHAFAQVDAGLPEPVIHTAESVLENIGTLITGANGDQDLKTVKQWLDRFAREPMIGIDYETNGKRPYAAGAKILSAALSNGPDTIAIGFRHRQAKWTPEQYKELRRLWRHFLLTAKCRKVSHHLGFEQEWSAFFFGKDVIRAGKWGCSLTQAYILDERQKSKPDPLSLDFLCLQYFGLHLKVISNLDRKNLEKYDLEVVLKYNSPDARYHILLYKAQHRRLKREDRLVTSREAERRVPTMVLTQLKGVPVDFKKNEELNETYSRHIRRVSKRLLNLDIVRKFQRRTGEEFSPSNNDHVAWICRNELRVRPDENGKLSTDEKVLSKIKHPFAKQVLRFREFAKLKSTYVEPFARSSPLIYPDRLLHPILSTTKTRTWRLASEDPNEQNVPKREHREVRGQIRPGKGKKIVAFDYGQIQARNIAMESKDKALIQALWDRYDIHADWTERFAYAYPSWVGGNVKNFLSDKDAFKKFRNKAKNEFVFPSFFGARASSLAGYLGIPEEITAEQQEEFWKMFPHVKDWQERLLRDYKELGYVTGLSGHRRHAPISQNQIINSPIQADEAIIVCDAMSRLSETGDWDLQASMMIHDDISFMWDNDNRLEDNCEIVIDTILNVPFEWAKIVPITVEVAMGDDWDKLEHIGDFSSDTWK